MKSPLSEMQDWFATRISSASPVVTDALLESIVLPGPDLTAAESLEIYREQFWLRHLDALEEDFPAVATYLGESEFRRLVERYLRAHPPSSHSLGDLGARFADLAPTSAASAEEALFLEELARLEWAFCEVFLASPPAPLDLERFRSIPPELWTELRLVPAPTLRVLMLHSPVHEYRRTVRKRLETKTLHALTATGRAPGPWSLSTVYEDLGLEAQTFDPPLPLAVYRNAEFSLFDKPLAPGAAAILENLRMGATLLEACEEVASRSEAHAKELETGLGAWFSEFAALGFLVERPDE